MYSPDVKIIREVVKPTGEEKAIPEIMPETDKKFIGGFIVKGL